MTPTAVVYKRNEVSQSDGRASRISRNQIQRGGAISAAHGAVGGKAISRRRPREMESLNRHGLKREGANSEEQWQHANHLSGTDTNT